jgi:hypothetical protein
VPKLLYWSEKIGCGATIELDSGEVCLVSVAQAGVLVKARKKGRFAQLLINRGAILYDEKNVYVAAKTAMALDMMFHNKTIPQTFQNPVLYAFANAVWNCPTAAEVAITLNEATSPEG